MDYADIEMDNCRRAFAVGEEYEPRQLVFMALLAEAFNGYHLGERAEPCERVKLQHIVNSLKIDGHNMNSWQVSQTLKELSFERIAKGGTIWYRIEGKDKLSQIAKSLDIQDECLEA